MAAPFRVHSFFFPSTYISKKDIKRYMVEAITNGSSLIKCKTYCQTDAIYSPYDEFSVLNIEL